MNRTLAWVIIALAVLGVAFAGISAAASREAVEIVRQIKKEPVGMAALKSSWVDVGGFNREVTTTKQDGESDEAHAARHDSAFQAMLKLYPKG